MKKKWWWIGAGGGVLTLLIAVSVVRSVRGNVESVQMAKVRVEDITSRVRSPGKIEPQTQVKVSADVPGKIVRLRVKEGDHVRKGQLLLELDATQYEASLGQARASLASARARLREAEGTYKVAASNFERQRALFDTRLLSQAEWDQAERTHESARIAVQTAREEVARAQAAFDGARDNVAKCRFEAPIEGVVSALNVEVGEIVIIGTMNNPGTQILVVSDLSRMLVRADVDETDVVDVQLDQKAKITVDAMPDTSFPGRVIEIGNTAKRNLTASAEGQTNFEVKVVFEENVPEIRPGMTADVEIETATHADAHVVPIQAVVVRTDRELERARGRGARRAGRNAGAALAADGDTAGRKEKEITGMFVVREGLAKFVPVRTGIASETMIEIFSDDIEAGEQVVSGPYKALRELKPGARVKQESPGRQARR